MTHTRGELHDRQRTRAHASVTASHPQPGATAHIRLGAGRAHRDAGRAVVVRLVAVSARPNARPLVLVMVTATAIPAGVA
jgi:hypothetical protein